MPSNCLSELQLEASMMRACILATIVGILPITGVSANDYDPSEMPGTYQYCQRQLDETLRRIDWQLAPEQVDNRVLEARQRYERCLRDRPQEASNSPSGR